jgi:hypothetical protein
MDRQPASDADPFRPDAPPVPVGTSLGELAASLSPGSWGELEVDGAALGAYLESGGTSGKSIFEYADKAVWDPIAYQLRFVGSPHYEAYKVLIYDDASGAFGEGPMLPGIPFDTVLVGHGYQHNALDPATGDSFYRPYNSADVYRYHAGAWTALPPIPGDSRQCCGGLEWFPERDGLLFVDGDWGVFFHDGEGWSKLADTSVDEQPELTDRPMGDYSNVALYSPTAHAVIFGGGGGSHLLYLYGADGQIRPLAPAPIPIAVNETVTVVDPVSGNLLVLGADRSFREYDVLGEVWRALDGDAVPIFNGSYDPPIFDIVGAPVSTYGVVVFLKYDFDRSKVFVYKHTGGA